ncbi:MAG: baseplate J/gp47 family protein [Spirochaetales bacterium]|nr:baseplate J/gp47 family protein [Spirochaetales bacterium]
MLNKTEDEVRQEVLTIAAEETGIRNNKSTGVLRGIFETFAKVIHQIYRKFLNPIYKRTNLDSADGDWLDQWGLLSGITRKAAAKTRGNVTLSAYQNGSIEAGTWITVEGTDLRFKVLETTEFSTAASFLVPVEAEFAGARYNITDDAGECSKVIPGVDGIVFGEDWITSIGTDDEDDETYRKRIKDLWNSIKNNNPPSLYEYYALSVEGVKSIRLIRTPRGYGTVDIIVVAENGLPSQQLLDAVYQAIYDHDLVCQDLRTLAPETVSTTVTVEYRGAATANEIQEAVLQYIYSLGVGGRMELRRIYDVLDGFNLDQAEVIAPVRDVQASQYQIVDATVVVRKLG